ncbi:MAG: hypothetical protein AB7G25_10790, partial [Sphingomonadaceae bacterium]
PAACSFNTLMICSSVNLLLRMSVSRKNGTLPKIGDICGEQVTGYVVEGQDIVIDRFAKPRRWVPKPRLFAITKRDGSKPT